MTKVITYGTYDLLHYGHVRLLERAKALGDYLIVGVTADDFDKTRGKINVQQSLMERIEAVRAAGIADEIIIEEYEGQKIDDIIRYDIDVFTVGSDWKGKFDYLNEYCKVIYLDRTEGISSSEIRTQKREIRIGLVGEAKYLEKFAHESSFVNGISIAGICAEHIETLPETYQSLACVTDNYSKMLDQVDAVYIISHPSKHYEHVKAALLKKKHVLCESPSALKKEQCQELLDFAHEQDCIFMESIKTAYSTAYYRLLLLAKSGRIGEVVSVDATCTSLRKNEFEDLKSVASSWNSTSAWGPVAMLPVFQILGTKYLGKTIVTRLSNTDNQFDIFTKIAFTFSNAVASITVGKGVKSEGELVVSGTEGYIYVPAPWWKTDYFEIRYENPENNKRYFYQLDGEGIRYEIVAFVKAIETGKKTSYITEEVTKAIVGVIDDFNAGNDVVRI